MPEKSKVMTQNKRDTTVLRNRGLGVRPATAHWKNYTAEKVQENNSGRCKKGRLKRENDYDLRKVRNCREKCKDRRLWNEILKQAKTHLRL